MRNVFHKIMSISMAFVVLITTMSFTIDMHYCGNTLVDVALFKEAKSCGMEMQQYNNQNIDLSFTKKSCCSDKKIIIEGQDNLKDTSKTINLEQEIFITSFIYSYINLFEGIEETKIPFTAYSPPYIKQDVQVLHQVFLI
ncbi:hypothetical protein AWE51_06880 [Aquimarina aggregata]|uniref:Secreted protein n=2 Tax=Aquimarina aggregata TaxID=1642818 RepID=A0A163AN52_9FLAO|nr:hypothetical protein AWE51_06880 [Aquimarina aggregata]